MTSNAHAVLKIPRGACVYMQKRFCDSVTKLIILKLVLGKIMLGEKNGFQFKFPPPTFKHTIAINLLVRGITGDPEIKFLIHVKFTLLR